MHELKVKTITQSNQGEDDTQKYTKYPIEFVEDTLVNELTTTQHNHTLCFIVNNERSHIKHNQNNN